MDCVFFYYDKICLWLCKVCMPKCSAPVRLAIVHHIFKYNHGVTHKSDPWPDLPLCLGVIKHRASLARGAHLPAKHFLRWIVVLF